MTQEQGGNQPAIRLVVIDAGGEQGQLAQLVQAAQPGLTASGTLAAAEVVLDAATAVERVRTTVPPPLLVLAAQRSMLVDALGPLQQASGDDLLLLAGGPEPAAVEADSAVLPLPEPLSAELLACALVDASRQLRGRMTQHRLGVAVEALLAAESSGDWGGACAAMEQQLHRMVQLWGGEAALLPDLRAPVEQDPWGANIARQLRALALEGGGHAVRPLRTAAGEPPCWGCVVKAPSGAWQAGVALWPGPACVSGWDTLLPRAAQLVTDCWGRAHGQQLEQCKQQEAAGSASASQLDQVEAMTHMTAGIAHQISTPLGVALSAISALHDLIVTGELAEAASRMDLQHEFADVRRLATLVQRNIDKAGKLVTRFKEVAVRLLPEKCDEIDFGECVDDIISLLKSKLRSKGIEVEHILEISPGCQTWFGDPSLLTQVVTNLVQNVMDHAYPQGEGGRMEVRTATSLEHDQATFSVQVRDFGVGISLPNRSMLFSPFYAGSGQAGSLGIGLTIVHNIVQSIFRGEVTVDSKEGQGATFTVSFTHCHLPEAAAAAQPEGDGAAALGEFVELQTKLGRGESLTVTEHVQLSNLKLAFDRYVAEKLTPGSAGGTNGRIPAARRVEIACGERVHRAELREIGEQGAAHLTDEQLLPGAEVEVLYAARPPLIVPATVTGCLEYMHPDEERPRWLVDVSFNRGKMAEEQLRYLKTIIAEFVLQHANSEQGGGLSVQGG